MQIRIWLGILLGLLIVLLTSTYKTLKFYFWHDDFSWFYHLRNDSCFSFWPYNTFCNFLGFFYQILGYNAFLFHLLGVILLFLTTFSFFLLCKTFFEKKVAFLLAAVFATVYIGSGAFVEAHSPLLVLTPLLLLILSLILLSLSCKERFKPALLFLSILTFGLSVYVAPIRSSSHIFPAATYIFLLLNKISIKRRLILLGIFTTVYFLTFSILPLGSERKSAGVYSFMGLNPVRETNLFLQTIGALVLTDELQSLSFSNISSVKFDLARSLLGLIGGIGFFIYLWKQKNKTYLKVALLALAWIVFFYAPYGIKFDSRIPSNHRYLLSMFPGIILAWGIFFKWKYWKYITVLLILAGIIQSNIFFNPHVLSSQKRISFYSQLHSLTKDFEQEPIVFFDFSPSVKIQANDYSRVGYYPSEAALGTEYQIPFEQIKLATEDRTLRNFLVSEKFNKNHLYTYYYDGELLTETTKDSRDRFRPDFEGYQSDINKSQNAKFFLDKNTDLWTSSNQGIIFLIKDFKPIIPSKLSIEISASVPPIKLPYTQGCINCIYNPTETELILDYLTRSKEIKSGLKVGTSNAGEETKAENIADGSNETYWIANRQEWFKGEKPIIKIVLKDDIMIEGFILTSISNGRLPKNLEVKIDKHSVNKEIVQIDDKRVKVIVSDPRLTKELAITILETNSNDSPVVSDIDIAPIGFKNIDVLKADSLKDSPSPILQTNADVEVLKKYLVTGGKACIQWQQAGYGKGSKNIDIFVDGQKHTYQVDLPVAGIGIPEFHLGCLNFPVDLEIFSANVGYLKGSD